MQHKNNQNRATLRHACEADAAVVCNVFIRSVREVCSSDYGNDEVILQDWCANKTPEIVAGWITDASNVCIVAELAPHGIVGIAMYHRPETSLRLCYVTPEGLRKGIGSQLLVEVEQTAILFGHKQIELVSSITAHDFYRRHGYSDAGSPVYYGKVLGYPMRKAL
jgi:GNAT superfamily N-acetyltransferase